MRVLLVVVTVVVASLFGTPFAQAQNSGSGESLPSGRAIVDGFDALGVKKAPVAVVRSIDRGYDAKQVVEGLASSTLEQDGRIISDDESVSPASQPAGVIKHNGADGGRISVTRLRRAVARLGHEGSILEKHFEIAKRGGDFSATGELLLLAALNGYTPEQLILDLLLADHEAFEVGPATGSSSIEIVLIDEEGDLIAPEGTPIPHDVLAQDWIKEITPDLPTTGTYSITFTTSSGSCEPSSVATGTLLDETFTLVDPDGSAVAFAVAKDGHFSGSEGGINIKARVKLTTVKGTWSFGGDEPCSGFFRGNLTFTG